VVLCLDRFLLNPFRNTLSSNSQLNIWQMDPLENWQWLKSDVQYFQRSWVLRWAFSPARAKLSVEFPQICISQRFSGESPHYRADQMLRGCQSADNQFQALQNQEIEDFFSPWFPASGARSRSSTNPAFTDFSPILDTLFYPLSLCDKKGE
jgi:hypothetical protein